MRFARLFRTTAMRLAMRYAVLFAILMFLGMSGLFWAIDQFVDAQVVAGLNAEMDRLVEIDKTEGRHILVEHLNTLARRMGTKSRYYLLENAAGEKIAGSLLGWPVDVITDGQVKVYEVEDNWIPNRNENDDGYWPAVAVRLDDGGRLLVTQVVNGSMGLIEFIFWLMAAIVLITVGLALLMGWRMGRALLRRIEALNHTASQVAEGKLATRVPLSGRNDEFDALGAHLNYMLERIETLVNGMREVTDNVAHDLRKPLTRIRNRLEVALLESEHTEDDALILSDSVEDIGELVRTFNALMEIAQAEAGSFRGEWTSFQIDQSLGDLSDLYQDQAELDAHIFVHNIETNLVLTGNRHLFVQAVSNLLDNAFKYTGAGGKIWLEAEMVADAIEIRVRDNGPGVAANERDNVTRRFYRLDNARSTVGNGLGLSLVLAVCELHRARLMFADNGPGLAVTLRFETL